LIFPLKNYKYTIPTENEPGGFGFIRKHDIHTGIDLYCSEYDLVYSISDGIVLDVVKFTGFEESPWWNDTYAIIIHHKEIGTVVYGELESLVKKGDEVKEGDIIGKILTVLKKDKGKNPVNMLHIELYDKKIIDPVIWDIGEKKPKSLKSPKNLLSLLYENKSIDN
jgi:murein DD-endopeptidase MepM/ murein hydrolase activator NlpD